jgi:putative hemolysin
MEEAYTSNSQMIMFPAGLVSRKQKEGIKDLEWQKSFVSKAVQHQRDIIPIYIDAKNSDFFYNLAKFRKFIRLKANLEMLYLPDETFKQRNKSFTLYVGSPISWKQLDYSRKPIEWAQTIKEEIYRLKGN